MQQDSMIPRPNPVDTTPDVATAATIGGPKQSDGWRGALATIAILIAAPLMALLVINFVFQTYQVDGQSMETTLQDRDRLIVDKIPRTWARITHHAYIPKRGDVVIFIKSGLPEFNGADKQLVKRVIGLPGDRVVVSNSKITIYNAQHPNGFNPDAGVAWSKATPSTGGNVDVTIGKDQVFVCGDNRYNSIDSRIFGPISSSDIVGKLSFRVYPVNKFEAF